MLFYTCSIRTFLHTSIIIGLKSTDTVCDCFYALSEIANIISLSCLDKMMIGLRSLSLAEYKLEK